MNQITVSLSHNRGFNHATAQRVSALLDSQISSQPSDLGVKVGCSGAWEAAAGIAGDLTPLVSKLGLPFNIMCWKRSPRAKQHRTCGGYLINVEQSQECYC